METVETIVSESGKFRARIEVDPDPQMPDGDALAPVFRIGERTFHPAKVVSDYEPTDLMPGDVTDALERFDRDYDKVERYLRMFHGVTAIEWITPPQSSGDTFLVFDTPDWCKHVGIPENMGAVVDGTANEWRAWIEGDVFAVVVEHYVRGVTHWHDNTVEHTGRWDVVDSCGGFYGREHAESEAKSMLKSHE